MPPQPGPLFPCSAHRLQLHSRNECSCSVHPASYVRFVAHLTASNLWGSVRLLLPDGRRLPSLPEWQRPLPPCFTSSPSGSTYCALGCFPTLFISKGPTDRIRCRALGYEWWS